MAASTARSLLKFTSPASSLLRYGDAFTRTKRRSKKGKKVKDRFAPKRGATAYAYYKREMRQSVKGEDSTGKNKKAVTKVLGSFFLLLVCCILCLCCTLCDFPPLSFRSLLHRRCLDESSQPSHPCVFLLCSGPFSL